MLDTGVLNANLIRSYPFIYNSRDTVPNWLVVDFRAIIHEGRWDPTQHRIFLAWVTRYGDRLRFGFRTDAPDMADQELIFERSMGDTRYLTTFSQSTPLAETLEERCGCSVELLCNSNMDGAGPVCGPELLCNPLLSIACDEQLLCEDDNCDIVGEADIDDATIC